MNNGTTPKGAPVQPTEENAVSTGTKTEKLIKATTAEKSATPKKNGGKRPGAGRKPKKETLEKRGLAEEMEAHLWETVEVIVKNRQTGATTTEKRTRFRAMLDTLAEKGIKDKDVPAIKEYFDRTTGKPAQQIAMKHSGEVGTYTAKRPSKAALAAKRAYERASYGKGA